MENNRFRAIRHTTKKHPYNYTSMVFSDTMRLSVANSFRLFQWKVSKAQKCHNYL